MHHRNDRLERIVSKTRKPKRYVYLYLILSIILKTLNITHEIWRAYSFLVVAAADIVVVGLFMAGGPGCHFYGHGGPGCHYDGPGDPGCHYDGPGVGYHYDGHGDPGCHYDVYGVLIVIMMVMVFTANTGSCSGSKFMYPFDQFLPSNLGSLPLKKKQKYRNIYG